MMVSGFCVVNYHEPKQPVPAWRNIFVFIYLLYFGVLVMSVTDNWVQSLNPPLHVYIS